MICYKEQKLSFCNLYGVQGDDFYLKFSNLKKNLTLSAQKLLTRKEASCARVFNQSDCKLQIKERALSKSTLFQLGNPKTIFSFYSNAYNNIPEQTIFA